MIVKLELVCFWLGMPALTFSTFAGSSVLSGVVKVAGV